MQKLMQGRYRLLVEADGHKPGTIVIVQDENVHPINTLGGPRYLVYPEGEPDSQSWFSVKLEEIEAMENGTVYDRWACIFPGKMGLSWKLVGLGSKEQAEEECKKHCNTVAIPEQLYVHLKNLEHRVTIAERTLNHIRVSVQGWNTEKEGR